MRTGPGAIWRHIANVAGNYRLGQAVALELAYLCVLLLRGVLGPRRSSAPGLLPGRHRRTLGMEDPPARQPALVQPAGLDGRTHGTAGLLVVGTVTKAAPRG